MTDVIESGLARTIQDSDRSMFVVDTDIHELLRSHKDLLPHLAPSWRRHLSEYNGPFAGSATGVPTAFPYSMPTQGKANSRLEWQDPDHTPGTSLSLMQKQLFDGEGVSLGILNGLYHPSAVHGNYDLMIALASAYNDWQIATWLDPEPRLRGSIHVVAHDPAAAVREIERLAGHPQMVQVFLPLATDRQYGDPCYLPIFETALAHGLVVAFHHGTATQTLLGYPRNFIEWHMLAAMQAAQNQIVSLICNGIFDRLPELRVAILEASVSWVPSFFKRFDQQYRELRIDVPWVHRLPTEYLRDNIRMSTQPLADIRPREFLELVTGAGLDRVFMFSTDYPHYDADSVEAVLPKQLPDEFRSQILHQNAIDTYPRLAGVGR
ncbi:amidohydrolase family protein [Pseudonocardia ailaonensis]|uniref:Amidohydrolase family protein n=1 Tax=Pseudonocardia ailaonensis TaxID=367279 RepID=A0ABN2N9S6_9PSEU